MASKNKNRLKAMVEHPDIRRWRLDAERLTERLAEERRRHDMTIARLEAAQAEIRTLRERLTPPSDSTPVN